MIGVNKDSLFRVQSIPNFFIVGAAKAGTTSLWMYLKQHPEVFMPESIEKKEPSYFCNIYGQTHYEKYLEIFKNAGEYKAIGEASTAYLTSSESAVWIRNELPEAKIIIILRNPVDRAYSLYRWMVNHGYEWVYPFEKALEIECSRKSDPSFFRGNPQYFYNYMYYETGLYSKQVIRYYKAFPIEQIMVVLLDDLKQKPIETIQKIYAFLGVDDTFMPEIKVHNTAELRPAIIRSNFILHKLQRKLGHRQIGKLARFLCNINMNLLKLHWPKMRVRTKRLLTSKYQSDIKETQRLIHQELKL